MPCVVAARALQDAALETHLKFDPQTRSYLTETVSLEHRDWPTASTRHSDKFPDKAEVKLAARDSGSLARPGAWDEPRGDKSGERGSMLREVERTIRQGEAKSKEEAKSYYSLERVRDHQA